MRHGAERPSPLLMRHAVPDEWRIVLVVPHAEPGLSGLAENQAFAKLVPSAERSAAIAQLVLTSLLPALVERDLEEFGGALTRVQQLVGDAFAPVQGGRFHPRAGALVEALVQAGAAAPARALGAGRLRRGRQRSRRARARPPDGGCGRRRGERGAGGGRQPRRPERAIVKLLVSVVDAVEARAAAAAGADIVDVKNPAEGSWARRPRR